MDESPATFDVAADAAYFPMVAQVGVGESAKNVVIERPGGILVLDFDAEGCLLGIEVVGAGSLLRTSTIEALEASR